VNKEIERAKNRLEEFSVIVFKRGKQS